MHTNQTMDALEHPVASNGRIVTWNTTVGWPKVGLAMVSLICASFVYYTDLISKMGGGGKGRQRREKGKGRGKILIPGCRRSVRQYLRIYLEKGKVS
jgi:hypothetical protein